MLRLVAAQAETLWDEALPIEVRELPRGSRCAGCAVVRSGAAGAVYGVLAARGTRVRELRGRARPADDRDRDLRAADGAQGATARATERPSRRSQTRFTC